MENGWSVYDYDEYIFEQKSVLLRKDISKQRTFRKSLKLIQKNLWYGWRFGNSIDTEDKYSKNY